MELEHGKQTNIKTKVFLILTYEDIAQLTAIARPMDSAVFSDPEKKYHRIQPQANPGEEPGSFEITISFCPFTVHLILLVKDYNDLKN